MFFTIYADDEILHDPNLASVDRVVSSPKLTLEINKAGSLTFVIPPTHELYNSLVKLKTIIRVYRDNQMIFKGRIINDERDFYNRKHVYCEGALSFLLDSQMRPYDITGSVSNFLGIVIDSHNNYVDSAKQFTLGRVTVSGVGNVRRQNLDYSTTLDVIGNELIAVYGGYFQVREVNNVTYLDYLSAYDAVSTQVIEFGKNLLDLTEYISAEDIFTVLVPLGAQEKDAEGKITGRVTIESVNNGQDYLINQDAVNFFGRIEKVQTWDKITSPAALLTNAQALMSRSISTGIKLEIGAVDLNLIDSSIDTFDIGELVRVVSDPHDIDTIFQVSKIEYDLITPSQSTYTFDINFDNIPEAQFDDLDDPTGATGGGISISGIGSSVATEGTYYAPEKKLTSSSLTEKTVSNTKTSSSFSFNLSNSYNSSLGEAKKTASDLINNGLGGYVLKTNDELYIMNTDSLDTATKVWRWNLGGLGYWSGSAGGARGGSYGLAMTQDGAIVADFITTGSLRADRIESGTITANKIEIVHDNSWLHKISEMTRRANSSSSQLEIGDWSLFSQQFSGNPGGNYITFNPTDVGGISFTAYPAGMTGRYRWANYPTVPRLPSANSITCLLVFLGGGEEWALTKEEGFIPLYPING